MTAAVSMMARKVRGLLTLSFLVSSLLIVTVANELELASPADHPDPMFQRLTRRLQETSSIASTSADTASVTTAAANIGPPSLDGMRSGVQNFFGRVGEWFAEVGQLRPRLPSLPQRAQRGSPSTGSGSGSSSGRDRDNSSGRNGDSSRSGRDDSSSRRSDSISGRPDRDSSRRDRDSSSSSRISRRDEAQELYFQPPDIMESGRVSRREERSSRRESRRSARD